MLGNRANEDVGAVFVSEFEEGSSSSPWILIAWSWNIRVAGGLELSRAFGVFGTERVSRTEYKGWWTYKSRCYTGTKVFVYDSVRLEVGHMLWRMQPLFAEMQPTVDNAPDAINQPTNASPTP